jgi:demethylmenaquinone methyltransferase/2-methoxy-6-polyprenyl-1,4-benzoquinol methylase
VSETATELRELFDDNAETYDRVNTAISLGLDARWRNWAARRAVAHPGARVLDAFAGTGLTGIRAAELGADVTLADFSPVMLAVAARHAEARRVRLRCVAADLASVEGLAELPAPFDAIVLVFGVRYLEAPAEVLARLSRLLVVGGRLVLVEFAEPSGAGWLSRLASVYFFRVLPRLATALAGRGELYEQLIATTRAIRSAGQLERIVRDAGMEVAERKTMGFGLVTGIVAQRNRA